MKTPYDLKMLEWFLRNTYDEVRQAAFELGSEQLPANPNTILKRIEANRKVWLAAKRAPKKPKQGG